MNVCIVGGGPAGLSALHWLKQNRSISATLFEQKDDIGGVWHYNGDKQFKTSPRNLDPSKKFDKDPERVTSMYDDLVCNIPYPGLELLHFKHPLGRYSQPSQKELYQYLRDYVTHFNLWSSIRVSTAIVDIRPEDPSVKEGEPCKWIVETHNHAKDELNSEIFDAVVVCTGHHTYPYPEKFTTPGLENFKGTVIHSKYFKNEDDFKDKEVVLIGLGASSGDIALILSKVAKSVTVCHKHPLGFKLGLNLKNAREAKNVKFVTECGVVTEDDENISCDSIIYCTGYALKYPFLNESCGVQIIEEKYIPNLYKMTVFTKRPTLFFTNTCYRAPEFITSDIQGRYVASVIAGKTKLPSFADMEAEVTAEEDEKRRKGLPYSIWFFIGDFGIECIPYFLKMAEDIGVGHEYRHGPLLDYLWNTIVRRIFGMVTLYKHDRLEVVEEGKQWILTKYGNEELFPGSKTERVSLTLNDDRTLAVKTLKN